MQRTERESSKERVRRTWIMRRTTNGCLGKVNVGKYDILVVPLCKHLRDGVPRRCLLSSSASALRCYPTNEDGLILSNILLNERIQRRFIRNLRYVVEVISGVEDIIGSHSRQGDERQGGGT